ncbi:hypothetical protein EJ06DRAFT_54134 [Trichodelitschia bisporula]|uniref:BCAS3 domain-containing protein n=1 Tax=Trichodelitschia bisporula TaxID=703511 RepID=A0A6G1HTV3_9PEZI|nr:hypothetical protein EJ06DRAFT_54134 [Trichodelitschia bisporula]
MTPSADDTPQYTSPNNYNYQRTRAHGHPFDGIVQRSHGHHEAGRRETYGEKLPKIYPRELKKSSAAASRYPSPSSPRPITSPLLSALGTTTSTAAQYTSDWTKSLPFFASTSPGSNASSPPTQIPIQVRDGGLGFTSVSPSPPSLRTQSHPNNPHHGFGGRQHPSPHHRDRRSSMYAHHAGRPAHGNHIPLPHEDQAHFHPGGLPDFNSIGMAKTGLVPGEKGYACAFDSLGTSGHVPSSSAENVLHVGYEGGVLVYRIARKGADVIGRLDNLRGAVIGAKVLPWTCRSDPGRASRPYIALVVHGPVFADDEVSDSSNSSAGQSDAESPTPSSRPSSSKGKTFKDVVTHYQTTVEVYSLSAKKHIATLYSSPRVEVEYTSVGECKIPPPVGDLRVDANGKFVVVASGISGEIFIFSPYTKQGGDDLDSVRCIGKLWTCIQPREPKASSNTSNATEPSSPIEEDVHGVPLFSLSNRWIATVPPPSAYSFSLGGTALLASPDAPRPPGIAMHMSPPPPSSNCAVDLPGDDDFVNRVSREVTQGVIKGAKWMGEQGMQAWNSYWSKGEQNRYPTNGHTHPEPPTQQFPPTHAYTPPVQAEPTQVAIFDLQRFLDAEEVRIRNVLQPIATFEPPSGCSFVSFAPSGLALLTVSKKGDEQFVWCLMRTHNTRSPTCSGVSRLGPYVRQIAKFTRMTVSSVVDVAWLSPQGIRFAVVTERGTIHVHELPASAFQWPPFRRGRRLKQARNVPQDPKGPPSPKGALTSAMDTINGTSTWLRSVRQRSGSGSVGLGGLAMAPANVGSKVVKAGFSKGFSAVASSAETIYHAGENKLHLEASTTRVAPGCMRWMSGKDKGSLAIVTSGIVCIYSVRQTTTARKGKPPLLRAKISKKAIELPLHTIPNDQFAPATRAVVEAKTQGAPVEGIAPVAGMWNLRAPSAATHTHDDREHDNWHVPVEAESDPPYPPFHTDRRVSLFAYPEPEEVVARPVPDANDALEDFGHFEDTLEEWKVESLEPWLRSVHHVDDDEGAWMYGAEIKDLKLLLEGTGVVDDSADEMEMRVSRGEDGTQLVVTTVRKAGREEDFFEDDCDVIDFADERV